MGHEQRQNVTVRVACSQRHPNFAIRWHCGNDVDLLAQCLVCFRIDFSSTPPPFASEVGLWNPRLIDINHTGNTWIDPEHLLSIEWPKNFVPLEVACEGDTLDRPVPQMKFVLQYMKNSVPCYFDSCRRKHWSLKLTYCPDWLTIHVSLPDRGNHSSFLVCSLNLTFPSFDHRETWPFEFRWKACNDMPSNVESISDFLMSRMVHDYHLKDAQASFSSKLMKSLPRALIKPQNPKTPG